MCSVHGFVEPVGAILCSVDPSAVLTSVSYPRLLQLRYTYNDDDLMQLANTLVLRIMSLVSYIDSAEEYAHLMTNLPLAPLDVLKVLEAPGDLQVEYQLQLLTLALVYACSCGNDQEQYWSKKDTYQSVSSFLVAQGDKEGSVSDVLLCLWPAR